MSRHPGLDDPSRRPSVPPAWHGISCRCDGCTEWAKYRAAAMAEADAPQLFGDNT